MLNFHTKMTSKAIGWELSLSQVGWLCYFSPSHKALGSSQLMLLWLRLLLLLLLLFLFFLFLLLLLSTKEGFVADVGAFWPEEAKCWPSLGCFARCRKAGHY